MNVTSCNLFTNHFDRSFPTISGIPDESETNTLVWFLTDGTGYSEAGRLIRPASRRAHPRRGRGLGSVTPRGCPLPSHPRGHLRASLQTHLRQKRGDVILHGLFRDAELLSDLAVGQAIADKVQDLAF